MESYTVHNPVAFSLLWLMLLSCILVLHVLNNKVFLKKYSVRQSPDGLGI